MTDLVVSLKVGLQSFLLAHWRALEEVQAQLQEALQAWRPGVLLERHHLRNDTNTRVNQWASAGLRLMTTIPCDSDISPH